MMLEKMKNGLVVSCQALPDEPLHSSFIMGRMAFAAKQGGAVGIRANGIRDIKAIKRATDLPIIGIIKKKSSKSEVVITPTLNEVEQLMEVGVDIIATDATDRIRPGESLEHMMDIINQHKKSTLLMADCSSIEDAVRAQALGFDLVASTLYGYTEKTEGSSTTDDDFRFLKELLQAVSVPVVAEGKINTPQQAKRALECGAAFVVVGSAITRPQWITRQFTEGISTK